MIRLTEIRRLESKMLNLVDLAMSQTAALVPTKQSTSLECKQEY